MILNCPQCSARFLVADSLIPAAGRTVRCGSCAHQWHVDNPGGAPSEDFQQLLAQEAIVAEEIQTPRPEAKAEPTPNVPAIAKKKWPVKPFKIAVPVLAAIWAILAFITYFPKGQHMPVLGAIYSSFGATPTEGLTFADVKMEREELEEGRTRFLLSGNIINHTEAPLKVPMAHVALNDADGNVIWNRSYPVHVTVKPGEPYPFSITNVETSFASKVKSITLDIGNSFELMMR